ncbi:MAG: prolipoprotein diacylglyceryl transferase [Clostridia bacterium]
MKEVIFPGIHLTLQINPIAFEILGVKITWYAILIVSAMILALILVRKNCNRYQIKFEQILEMVLWVIPISIICARIYFVLFKLEYYLQNPWLIFQIRNGGLAIYGGIIGAVFTIFTYCKIKKISFLDMLDLLVPYLALGQAIGRWGNFFNVEAYGYETNHILRMGIIENGRYIEVHPTFLYESIATFFIFLILIFYRNKRKYKGELTCIYFILYSMVRAIIEGLRTDSLMIGNIRISQALSIMLFLIFLFISLYQLIKRKKLNKKSVEPK